MVSTWCGPSDDARIGPTVNTVCGPSGKGIGLVVSTQRGPMDESRAYDLQACGGGYTQRYTVHPPITKFTDTDQVVGRAGRRWSAEQV